MAEDTSIALAGTGIAAACRRVVAGWHARAAPRDWDAALVRHAEHADEGEGSVPYLALVNCYQWHLEDRCRARDASERELSRLKCEIDRSNARRVRSVDAIDRRVARRLPDVSAAAAPPAVLVTPGAVADRLSILELKRYHAAAAGRPELAAVLAEELGDVSAAADELFADLRAGRRRLKLYATVKLYGAGDGDG